MRRDAYYLRLAATGFCFAVFGVGGLVLGLIVLPALRLLPGERIVHRERVRGTLGAALRWFAGLARSLGVLTYDIRGLERLGRPGQLVLANHPTLLDAVFLLGFAPSSSCVVKEALWRSPFTRWVVAAAGFVSNAPTELMITEAADTLRAGQSVIIFPEGTRTVPGQPLHFHRGAAAIAVRAATVVTPVYIRGVPPTLRKHDPWYRIPDRRMHFTLEAGEDIDPQALRVLPPPIAGRELNARLLQVFTAKLSE